MSKTKVAVYGSLRQGHGNNQLLQRHNATYLGTTTTQEKYAMYSLGGFPFVNLKEQVSPIVVEVYEVDDRCLSSLDSLEGYRGSADRSFYNRSKVKTNDGNEPFIYHIDERTNETLVESGDWNEYYQRRYS